MLKRGPYRQHRLRLLAQLETTLRSRECRRRLLVSHYEEFYPRVSVSTATGNCCDNCDPKHPGKTPTSANVAGPRRDCSRDARLLLLVVIALGGKWGLRATARILRGSRVRRAPVALASSPLRGCGRHRGNEWWLLLGRRLLQMGYLEEHSPHPKRFIMAMRVSVKGERWLRAVEDGCRDYEPILLTLPMDTGASTAPIRHRAAKPVALATARGTEASRTPTETAAAAEKSPETLRQEELYRLLKAERLRVAFERGVSPFLLASDSLLRGMARTRPSTSESLCCLHGVSRCRAASISTLLNTTRTFTHDNGLESDVFGLAGDESQPIAELLPDQQDDQSEATGGPGEEPSSTNEGAGPEDVGEGPEGDHVMDDGQSEPSAESEVKVKVKVAWFSKPMRSDSCLQRQKNGLFY
ncbi:bifunctional 3'-5' exonuclease/ATP-dependent helicase WRN-like [Petromyzon marinus]|uniref:bifunctional 3'-5' exonuclease/ATP-dependent helicase WRN-like n=1 Tax=Petromyzon marinus TaxID=7757 RepID=UPI003F6EDD62